MWHKAIGYLSYSIEDIGPKLVLNTDQGIADFYRSIVPKYINVNKPRYSAHISIVRKEPKVDMKLWGTKEGQPVEFEYFNELDWDELYIWLPIRSEAIKEIRKELGLAEYPWWINGYHLTVGNFK